MGGLVAGIAGSMMNAVMWVFAKGFTDEFFKNMAKKIIVFLLKELAGRTSNSLDDKIVEDFIKGLEG